MLRMTNDKQEKCSNCGFMILLNRENRKDWEGTYNSCPRCRDINYVLWNPPPDDFDQYVTDKVLKACFKIVDGRQRIFEEKEIWLDDLNNLKIVMERAFQYRTIN